MFKWQELVHFIEYIDDLAGFQKKAEIKIIFRGVPRYGRKIVSFYDGQQLIREKTKKEWYKVPIFCGHYNYTPLLQIAIHEVRHRVQYNYPGIRLFTIDDLPRELREKLDLEMARGSTPTELDAQVFEIIAYPVISAGNEEEFLKLLFRGTGKDGL